MGEHAKRHCRRTICPLILIAWTWICTGTQLAAQSNSLAYSIANAPGWVDSIAPTSSWTSVSTQTNEGAVYLLVDDQLLLGKETTERYHRSATKLTTPVGVQDNSSFSVDFDPSYQSFQFHHLRLLRGTNVFNRLNPGVIKVIQREEELERQMYDGRLSVVVMLDDVRVGDTIDSAYTIRGMNPVFGNRYAGDFFLRWSEPVDRRRIRLAWEKGRKPKWKTHGIKLEPTMREDGSRFEAVWEERQLPPIIPDSNLPIWYPAYPYMEISEFQDWVEVALWANELYKLPAKLPEALSGQLGELRKSFVGSTHSASSQAPAREDEVLRTLRSVQDEVRYLGIEMGASSHRPSPPDLVWQRRFGDCKDKALLLCSFLRELGFDARPALVNTSYRHTIQDLLPSPIAFDHVVVRVEWEGQKAWVDPTATHKRGRLSEQYFPPYGQALVVGDATKGLTTVDPPKSSGGGLTVRERFMIPDYTNPVSLRVQCVYSGRNADRLRSGLARQSREEYQKTCLNYYAQEFPSLKVSSPIEIHDNPERNTISTYEFYSISNLWTQNKGGKQIEATFYPLSVSDVATKPSTIVRTMPLAIPHPTHVDQTTEVVLPGDWNIVADTQSVQSAGMRFHWQTHYKDRLLTLRYEYESLTEALTAEQSADHIEKIGRVRDLLTYQIYRPADSRTGVATTVSEQVNWLVWALALLYSAVVCVVMIVLYRHRPEPVPTLVDESSQHLVGIGGWLTFIAIGMVINPFTLTFGVIKVGPSFQMTTWNYLTTPGTTAYHPLWAPILLFELITNLTLLGYSILLATLFFQKRASFPRFMIIFLVMNAALMITDHLLAGAIPAAANRQATAPDMNLPRAIMGCFVWIPYFRSSRRVKNTFVN